MGNVSNNQSFSANSNGSLLSGLVAKYKTAMDTVLQGGRNITIHLPPQKADCPGGCRYNSTYKRTVGVTGALCDVCGGQGFLYEPRYTIYIANIRQTEEDLNSSDGNKQSTTAGRISQKLVRTKTVIESYDHISGSIGATIDGEEYKLEIDPKKTGFGGTLLYVITYWKKMDK